METVQPATLTNVKNVIDGIDFDFIQSLEGGRALKAYVPIVKGLWKKLSKSGVTIASGVDLGQWTEYTLRVDCKVPPELLAKLLPYLGLQRQEAIDFLKLNPLLLTESEATVLDVCIIGRFARWIAKLYDTDYPGGPPIKWADLPPRIKTVIMSMGWNLGPQLYRKAPHAWYFITRNQWYNLRDELNNFHSKQPSLDRRRQTEAAYLGLVGENTDPKRPASLPAHLQRYIRKPRLPFDEYIRQQMARQAAEKLAAQARREAKALEPPGPTWVELAQVQQSEDSSRNPLQHSKVSKDG